MALEQFTPTIREWFKRAFTDLHRAHGSRRQATTTIVMAFTVELEIGFPSFCRLLCH